MADTEKKTSIFNRETQTGKRAILLAVQGVDEVTFLRAKKYLPGNPKAGLYDLCGVHAEVILKYRLDPETGEEEGHRAEHSLESTGAGKLAGKVTRAARLVRERFSPLSSNAIIAELKAVRAHFEDPWTLAEEPGAEEPGA